MRHAIGELREAALEVDELINFMTIGFYAHACVLEAAKHPGILDLGPTPSALMPGLSSFVLPGTLGSHTLISYKHWIEPIRDNPKIAEEAGKVWIAGALLRVGDALEQWDYFNRAPCLELIRHLRNGIAHGNRFRILPDKRTKKYAVDKYPAHIKFICPDFNEKSFVITPALNGRVILSEFSTADDVLQIFSMVRRYLRSFGEGKITLDELRMGEPAPIP